MSYSDLREAAARGNVALGRSGLVVLSFGNLSVLDRAARVMAIKPSGLSYEGLTAADMVVVDLDSGGVIEGINRPSADTPTHLVLYRAFADIGAVVHTHSAHATAWAQAQLPIPCLGTTHAEHFRGPVPVTRALLPEEIADDYEGATGRVIVERYRGDGLAPLDLPGVLVVWHGAFTWGATAEEALGHAIALEHVAHIATHQAAVGDLVDLSPALRERHFSRKHGPAAYYGQPVGATEG